MTEPTGFDRTLSDWLDDMGAQDVPSGVKAAAIDRARQTRRARPLPDFLTRWLPMSTNFPVARPVPVARTLPSARLAVAIALLALALLGAALLSAALSPSPPLAVRNGLIAWDANGDIMVANPDGSDPHALFTRSEDDTSPVWSPDGTRLAFWADSQGTVVKRPRSLGIVDADGSNLRIFPPPSGQTFVGYESGEPGIDWGPNDGRLMVRTQQRELAILDLEAGSWEVPAIGARQGMITGFDWSDDGRAVAFVTWDEFPHYEYVGIDDPLGADPTLPVRADPVEGSLVAVDWDPTSRYVAYNKALDDPAYDGSYPGGDMKREGGHIDIYTLDTRSGTSTLVREGTFYGAIFSPDGTRLAFGDDQGRMWATDLDGSNAVDLGVTRGAIDMEWAPDGSLLATMGNLGPESSQTLQMIIFRADGTGTPVAIDAPDNVGQPSWQPLL